MIAAADTASIDKENCANSPARLRLALVRHGESWNNVHEATSFEAYTTKRSPDPDLSPRGMEQAAVLGAFLGDIAASASLGIHPVTELWVSPVKRTLQTIAPTAAALGMRPRVHTRCFEAGGIYTNNEAYTSFTAQGGMTRAQMQAAFPTYELPDGVTEDGWYVDAEGTGRETVAATRKRCAGVAAELKALAASLTADRQIVLVAHYDFICALLDALVLGAHAPTGEMDNHGQALLVAFDGWRHFNTGVTVLDIGTAGGVSVLMANAITHLLLANRSDLVSGFDL